MKQVYSTLPAKVIPSHYSLALEPDFKTFTFKGEAGIEVEIPAATARIVLHAKELKIHQARITSGSGTFPAKIKIDREKQELHLLLPQAVKGKATLTISYTGIHNEGMYGFYRSKYLLEGKEEYLLTTQFEAPNARAAFPCFDEPRFKATFDLTLIVDKNLAAISNMPLQQQTAVSATKKKVTFRRTPRMSTYLLYIGVGHFVRSSIPYRRNISINIYTTPDKRAYTQLPLDYCRKFLAFFEDYFGIPYPLPKLDLIAIPDFAAGAMENWGAITFREIALLGDENTSVAVKQNIAITIAHELAHQWFGDLVTMEWWNDLWLNESFATFMSYKAVHAAYPGWELPLQYFEHTITSAFSADQVNSTHPIDVAVKTPGEIDEIFDRISYDKGGSVLHMLEDFVGEDNFRKGLARYLRHFSYRNATKQDLWNSIQQEYADSTVVPLVQRWITLPGYPVISVSRDKNKYTIEQERFTLLPRRHTAQWLVPVTCLSSTSGIKKILLAKKKTSFSDAGTWIKLNHCQHGFYRVHYRGNLLASAGEALAQKKISMLDAAGIENDLFAFTLAGKYSIAEYLAFVEKYCLHAEYPLDSGISGHLGWLLQAGYYEKFGDDVRRVSLNFHRRLLPRVGWERKKGESNTATLLRSLCLATLGLLGHAETRQRCSEWLEQIKQGKGVDANIRGVIYLLTAWSGGREEYNYLLERYKKEKIPEESRKLLRALGMFRDRHLLAQSLALSFSPAVRLQDSYLIPIAASMNPAADLEQLWQWTKQNWPRLQKTFSPGSHMLATFVNNFDDMNSAAVRADFQRFFARKENLRDDVKLSVKQVLEKSSVAIRMVERNK